ncbi:uncharacterized protein LOC106462696 isoform X2 [Limulus polyphemus]|nr:uncharacterized protein LOC106462696 isoform X2 [Limulus polyphemus]
MLRVSSGPLSAESSRLASFLFLDVKQKQVSLYDPTTCGTTSPVDRRVGVAAPKMFAFDAVFPPDTPQVEIISTALVDVIQSVVNGMDGCLFVYGNPKLGKTYTMIGESSSIQELGATPCAIAWLFKLISEQREKTGARFSVRASAVGVTGRSETIRDLLSVFAIGTDIAGSSPGLLLQDDPVYGTHLMNQSEIRAPTAEKAAFLLDAALAARSKFEKEEENRNSHFLFTLHVYQYRFEKGNRSGVAGGRSRLNLIDLGSCEKLVKPRDGAGGHNLSLSALGNVIIALLNGQKHVPYKDSKLTQLLREALGSLTCRAAMIAHVSSAPEHYSETLATIQLAARIHRLRRQKFKFPGASSSESSSDDRKVCRPFLKVHAITEDNGKSGSSDPDNTSSSEQSCDTVIFVGERGVSVSSCHVKRNVSLSPRPTKQNHNGQSAVITQESVNTAKFQYSFNSKNGKNAFASMTNASSRNALRNYSVGEKNSNVRVADRTIINTVEPNAFAVKTKNQHHQTEKRLNERLQAANSSSTSDHTIVLPEQGGLPNQSTGPQASRKYPFKHKLQYIKRNEGKLSTSSSHSNSAKTHSTRDPRVQSDELWIDGPRFCKSKFENLSLKSLQKEQWVDGPGFEFHGHIDEHKKQFISKWVEEHSQHVQQNIKDLKGEVWIDFPPLKKNVSCTEMEGNSSDIIKKMDVLGPEKQQNICELKKTVPQFHQDEHISVQYQKKLQGNIRHHNEAFLAFNEHNVPETWHQETIPTIEDHRHSVAYEYLDDCSRSFYLTDVEECNEGENQTDQHGTEDTNSDQDIELFETEGEGESVQMQDSCLQVNEEDIIVAMLQDSPSKCEGTNSNTKYEILTERPLKTLSKTDFALDSSFMDLQVEGLNSCDQEFATSKSIRGFQSMLRNVNREYLDLTGLNEKRYFMRETVPDVRPSLCWDSFGDQNLKVKEKSDDEYLETTSLPGKDFKSIYSDKITTDPEVSSTLSEPVDFTKLRLPCDQKLLAFLSKPSREPKPILAVSPIVHQTKEKSASLGELGDLELQQLKGFETQYPPRMFSHEVNKKMLAFQETGEKLLYSKPCEMLTKQQRNLDSHNAQSNKHSMLNARFTNPNTEVRTTSCDITQSVDSSGYNPQLCIPKNENEIILEVKPLDFTNIGALQNCSHQNFSKIKIVQDFGGSDVKERDLASQSHSKLQHCSTEINNKSVILFSKVKPTNNTKRFQKLDKRIKSPFISYLSREGVASLSFCDDNTTQTISGDIQCSSDSSPRNCPIDSPLISPYAKITQARSTKSSSGRGSDSSIVSGEPREGSKILPLKLHQLSGTSSGYESMMRDSEETPASSSQESGNECDTGEHRNKKGVRRKAMGLEHHTKPSTFHPLATKTSPTCRDSPLVMTKEPLMSKHHKTNEWHNSNLQIPDENVCCTGLLCCGVGFRKITSDLSYV